MKQNDCYQLGQVIKTHGLQGDVSISLDVDYPEDYKNLESVFLEIQGKLVPFFIQSIELHSNKARISFEDIDDLDAAKELVGSQIFLPLTALPSLEEGQYYFHDLINCTVFEDKKELGIVKEVIDLNGNELLVVINKDSQEILIPIKEEILKRVSVAKKMIHVALPDGLLDIYNE